MKLGISKQDLLSDSKIRMMYEEYMKKQSGKGKMKGAGLWDGFVKFLKDTKVLSNVGGVLLPLGGAALGGTLGTAFSPIGTATGTALGTATGKSASEWIKSQGFGRRSKMNGGGYSSGLVINPQGTRLGQKRIKGKGCGCGMKKMKGGAVTFGINGVYQHIPGTPAGTQVGRGITAFNTVSSQFGNVQI